MRNAKACKHGIWHLQGDLCMPKINSVYFPCGLGSPDTPEGTIQRVGQATDLLIKAYLSDPHLAQGVIVVKAFYAP